MLAAKVRVSLSLQLIKSSCKWSSVYENVSHKRSFSSLTPYVDPEYSYSYGRSTGQLVYRTINQGLVEICNEFPDRLAVVSVHQGIEKTYSQLESDINKLASSLYELGLRQGDTAGCWSGNIYEYVVVFHALAKLGVINCSLSTAYKAQELQYALEKANFKALFLPGCTSIQNRLLNDFHDVMSKLNYDNLPNLKHLIYLDNEESNVQTIKYGCTESFDMKHLLHDSTGRISEDIYFDPDQVSNLYLTSGTTGKPKLAAITHFGSINNMFAAIVNKNYWKSHEERPVCVPLPYFHVFAGLLGLNLLSVVPVTVVSPSLRYSARPVAHAIEKYRCKNLFSVPTILIDLNNFLKNCKNPIDVSSIEHLAAGAATVPPEVCREAKNLFPNLQRITVGYGATETHAVTTSPKFDDDYEIVIDSVGTAIDFVQMKIIDPHTNRILKHDETGEVCTRGHHVMQGYWNDKEKTDEVIENGWYKTGDLGTMDKNGVIRIVGRTKEMIIRGGINIFPREIEDLLQGHPDVLEVAVCGIPHPKLGEEVVAWIKLYNENAQVTADDIKSYCKNNISSYKVPSHVFFVNDFPLTASGKVQKFIMAQKTIEMMKQTTHEQ